MAEYQNDYKMDIVFVIDAKCRFSTEVKERVLTFGDEIREKMNAFGKPVGAVRMRLIDFGDFASEGMEAIRASRFFTMPDERSLFENQVKNIPFVRRTGEFVGNALEALWVAMRSDWVDLSGTARGRHIIVLITDAYPLKLGERKDYMWYFADLFPENVQEMEEGWRNDPKLNKAYAQHNHSRKKRLLIMAPDGNDNAGRNWFDVMCWESTIFAPFSTERGIDGDSTYNIWDDIFSEMIRTY